MLRELLVLPSASWYTLIVASPSTNTIDLRRPSQKNPRATLEREADEPLGQAPEEVPARALALEARNPEPAGLTVVLGPAVAGYGVLENLVPRASSLQLGRVREVTDDGDARDVAGRGSAEGAHSAGGRSGAAEEEGRHVRRFSRTFAPELRLVIRAG